MTEGNYRKPPVSDLEAETLQKPEVTLYAGKSADSYTAFEILEKSEISFSVSLSPRRRIPYAVWAEIQFKGVDGIQQLVDMFQAADKKLIEGVKKYKPHLIKNNPELERWLQDSRKRQLEEARAVMYP